MSESGYSSFSSCIAFGIGLTHPGSPVEIVIHKTFGAASEKYGIICIKKDGDSIIGIIN